MKAVIAILVLILIGCTSGEEYRAQLEAAEENGRQEAMRDMNSALKQTNPALSARERCTAMAGIYGSVQWDAYVRGGFIGRCEALLSKETR